MYLKEERRKKKRKKASLFLIAVKPYWIDTRQPEIWLLEVGRARNENPNITKQRKREEEKKRTELSTRSGPTK